MSARIPLTLARALAPIAPPQSEVHRIISEADALADVGRGEVDQFAQHADDALKHGVVIGPAWQITLRKAGDFT